MCTLLRIIKLILFKLRRFQRVIVFGEVCTAMIKNYHRIKSHHKNNLERPLKITRYEIGDVLSKENMSKD